MDRGPYRRRQRRRAIVAWTVAGLVVVGVALAAILGGGRRDPSVEPAAAVSIFAAEMSFGQYQQIHDGEEESKVLLRLHDVGLGEDEVEGTELPALFPARPAGSTCSYWTLEGAPGHFVRLCFSDPQGLVVAKSVAATGAGAAPKTLA